MKLSLIKQLSAACATVALLATNATTAFALPITVYEGVEGGSGDVSNVLYQENQTGTTVNATLNTSGGNFIAEFTSTASLSTSGGQAHLTAANGTSYTDLCFRLLNGATFTKLQLNPDVIAGPNGVIAFTVTYILPAGTFNSANFTLNANGQNFFTVLAAEGALMTEVCWTSNVGISDANQYRVGGAAPATGVPDGGTTLALLGLGLTGLGMVRSRLVRK